MKKTLLPALLATAMIPMVAVAQTTPAPDAPATDAPATDTATPPVGGADATAPAGATPGTDAPDAAEPAEPMDTPDAEADAPDAATTPAPADTASSGSAIEGPFVTVPPTGAWRVTDLNGKSVEDAAGESIGSISDVLVDENGEVIAVLVGVGGFLGIGAKDVAVAMDALEFGPGSMDGLPTAPAADAAPAGGMTADPAAAPATDAAPATPVVGEDNLPDRIVLAVTREELEAAPAYGEPETGEETDAGTGGMAPAPAPAQ